jgi:hypothetical protein
MRLGRRLEAREPLGVRLEDQLPGRLGPGDTELDLDLGRLGSRVLARADDQPSAT